MMIWFDYTVTLQNVIQIQKCEPCLVDETNFTPFPTGSFPPDTASAREMKAQTWLQFRQQWISYKHCL